MKKIIAITSIISLATVVQSQTLPVTTLLSPITINGQTFTLTANPNGSYTATTTGTNGTATATSPVTVAGAEAQIGADIAANDPSKTNYFSDTEIEAKLGGVYEQNSGQAAALISVTKWEPIKGQPIGFEAALLQGNQNGASGTAAAYGVVDYRKIIGSVAAVGGLGAGYDNYNKSGFGLVKGGVELRYNKNVGVFTDLNYAFEAKGNASRGFGFGGGITYSF